MNKELVCEAYSLLYDTETKLKEIIEKWMFETYGLALERKIEREKCISV